VIAAYWLDVQDRPDFSPRRRIAWSLAALAFPVSVPIYAFRGGADWPRFLRVASFAPAVALGLIAAYVAGFFGQ